MREARLGQRRGHAGRAKCPDAIEQTPHPLSPGGAWRGVRRYRHEPALYAQNRARLRRATSRPGRSARRGVVDSLDAFLITTVKYVDFAMRMDNDGEGGIIALTTVLGVKRHQRPIIIAVGLFGAALIYGDGRSPRRSRSCRLSKAWNRLRRHCRPMCYPRRPLS
jgi:hypothetical protein